MTNALIILPCNKGAYEGNYWNRPNWQIVDKRLEAFRHNLTYAAVESIRVFLIGDTRGLVLENESEIVRGFDLYPSWKFYNPKNSAGKMDKLTDAIKVSLSEITPEYEHVFALLSPRAYKLCFIAAMLEEGLNNKTTILDIGESPAYYNKGVLSLEKVVHNFFNGKNIPLGIFQPEGHDKYFDGAHGSYRTDPTFPKRYKFW